MATGGWYEAGCASKIWDAATGAERVSLVGALMPAIFSPGSGMVLVSMEREPLIYDAATGDEVVRFSGNGRPSVAAFSADGTKFVANAGPDVMIWNVLGFLQDRGLTCPAGLEIEVGGTFIISPEMLDGQLQTVACPNAGEVQLLCTTREVTELERTPDCGVGVEESSSRLLMLMAHILTLAVFGF